MRKVVDWQCDDGGESLHFRIKQMSATQAERFTFKILLLIGACTRGSVGARHLLLELD